MSRKSFIVVINLPKIFFVLDGQIAGIVQASLFKDWKSWGTNAPLVKYEHPKTGVFYGVEAHFRDPKLICDSSDSSKRSDIIGDRIWFRNGIDVDSLLISTKFCEKKQILPEISLRNVSIVA